MRDDPLPVSVRRIADRCDKAMDRREGAERIFLLVEELSVALAAAGFPGAADWVRQIADGREEWIMAA